jgi:alkylhydroperoxidase family enzyme
MTIEMRESVTMRIKPVFRPEDHPGGADADVKALFDYLRPGIENPEIDMGHAGIAIAALNPRVALGMAQLSRTIALETGWAKQGDLRELAFYVLNRHFNSDFSVEARAAYAEAAGLSAAQLRAVADWETSPLFSDTQRLVVEATLATVKGEMTDELFARVVAAFGDVGAMEFTALVGFWSCWAMVINAGNP